MFPNLSQYVLVPPSKHSARTVLQNITLSQGGNYWIVIDGFANSQGNYTLSVSCPAGSNQATVQGNVACGSVVSGNSATGQNTVGNAAPEVTCSPLSSIF